MPTIVVDARVLQVGDLIEVEARSGDDHVNSLLLSSELPTLQAFADWLLNQAVKTKTQSALQKRLTIDFHTETDPEGNTIRVVDNVTAEDLPEDAGRVDFQGLPGWATWTAQEAEDWIEANVVDLASAKVALQAMARAIVFLRNVTID